MRYQLFLIFKKLHVVHGFNRGLQFFRFFSLSILSSSLCRIFSLLQSSTWAPQHSASLEKPAVFSATNLLAQLWTSLPYSQDQGLMSGTPPVPIALRINSSRRFFFCSEQYLKRNHFFEITMFSLILFYLKYTVL